MKRCIKMDKIKLKKIMNDLAAGHISKKEAQDLINEIKTQPEAPVGEIKGKSKEDEPKINTRKRKKVLKNKEESK